MPTVVVATGNPHKLSEMEAYLGDLAWTLALKPSHLDIEETGDTFLANARLKAGGVAAALGQWAIADDSGLAVDALGGAPGIYSARYADTDAARIQRLLAELTDHPAPTDRAAQFVCALAVANPAGQIVAETEGICAGEILPAPQGEGGFGYDPIFRPAGLERSFAELTPAEKHTYSHRGVAFRQILPHLLDLDFGAG